MTGRRLTAIGAHADDIELNVGGTLLKYRQVGYDVAYVMTTNNMSGNWNRLRPDGSVEYGRPPWHEIMPQRKLEARVAAHTLGTDAIHLDHPQRHYARDGGVVVELRYGCERPGGVAADVPTILTAHEHPAAVQRLADLILEQNPEAILTHSIVMVDMEHLGSCLLVTKAYWKAVAAGYEGVLLHWQDITVGTFGEAYGRWDTFIDVSNYWEQKLALIALHACQIPDVGRLQLPAWGPACGCERAEVFHLVSRGKPPQDETPFGREILAHLER